jgi:3-phenylpropionate/trans-cinnamate dioxygenase ferredoxin reductase component
VERVVVVGASLAGQRAAQSLRSGGFDGEIVVLGDEAHPPYTRPPLSKEILVGSQLVSDCALPLRDLEVEWRLGTRATGLDRAAKEVLLEAGDPLGYDRLIAATGLRARPWPGPGGELRGVHTLRTLDDAAALAAELSLGRHLVIVGAGFIGCEVAASARKLGVEVTMLAADPHPLLPLGEMIGRWAEAMHRGEGVDVRCGCAVVALHGEVAAVQEVELGDGSSVPADAVLIAIGAVPNSEWLADSGLALDPGLICDETMTVAGDDDLLAAGDLASFPHPHRPGFHRRIEHWTVAAELGALAGRNALLDAGERVPYAGVPYVWSDQYGSKIQSIGHPGEADRFEVLESTADRARFVVLGLLDERPVAVITVNAAKRLNWYRRNFSELHDLESVRRLLAAEDSVLGPPTAVMV